MKSFDILIIGNGILGLSTAFALSLEDPTLKIGIIGPSTRPGSGTNAAGAMLGCFGEVTQTTYSSKYHKLKFDIAFKAAKIWPAWLEQINVRTRENKLKINPGTFIILNSKSGKLDNQNFHAILQALHTNHEKYEEIDPSSIPGMNPIDDCRPLRALYIPNEGSINPLQLLSTMDEILLQQPNINVINALATKIFTNDKKAEYIQISSGENIRADKIIVCAGAYTQSLIDQIPMLKDRIPKVLSGVGCSLLLRQNAFPINAVVRTPNRAGACGLHAVPYGANELFIGASNYVNLLPETKAKVRYNYYLLQYAMEQMNQDFNDAEILKWHIGNRPVTIDTFPLVGKTSLSNLWLLTGTYRDGLQNSPILAQSIAKQVLGDFSYAINEFLPERPPISTLTKQQAIAEFANQAFSTGYEHSMKLPRIGWDPLLKDMFSKRIETLYEKLEVDFGIPVEILLMIDRGGNDYVSYFREYYKSIAISSTKLESLYNINYVEQPVLDLDPA